MTGDSSLLKRTRSFRGWGACAFLSLALALQGCGTVSFFRVDRDLALSKGSAVVRKPVGFGALNVSERVQREIASYTEEKMSDRWDKMRGLGLIPPEKFRRAEASSGVRGYFDPATGKFDWNRFKAVLDRLGATAVLDFGYSQGTAQIFYMEGNSKVTETVASIDLLASLQDAETGAVLWESSAHVSPLKGQRSSVKKGMVSNIFLGRMVVDYTVEEVWNSKKLRKSFDRALKVLAAQMEKDFGKPGGRGGYAAPARPDEPREEVPEPREETLGAPGAAPEFSDAAEAGASHALEEHEEPVAAEPREDYIDLVKKSVRLIKEGRAGEALEKAREASGAEPSRPEAHLIEGRILFDRNDRTDAARSFEKVLKIIPDADKRMGYVRERLGRISYLEGDYERAAGHYGRVIMAARNRNIKTRILADSYAGLGLCRYRQGNSKRALKSLRKGAALGTSREYREEIDEHFDSPVWNKKGYKGP